MSATGASGRIASIAALLTLLLALSNEYQAADSATVELAKQKLSKLPVDQKLDATQIVSSSSSSVQSNNTTRRQDSRATDDMYQVGFGIADITGPSADINLVSLISQVISVASALLSDSSVAGSSAGSQQSTGAGSGNALLSPVQPIEVNPLIKIQHPTLEELQDAKLQLKINLKLLSNQQTNDALRWAMPNQFKLQAEFTFANLVVQL